MGWGTMATKEAKKRYRKSFLGRETQKRYRQKQADMIKQGREIQNGQNERTD